MLSQPPEGLLQELPSEVVLSQVLPPQLVVVVVVVVVVLLLLLLLLLLAPRLRGPPLGSGPRSCAPHRR